MRVAAYLRVSTQEQTTANQSPAIEAWVKSRGHELVEVYQENESAWRNGHQRELARLLSDLRSGRRKYDILLVWSLDRLTRAGIAAILTLVNTFKSYGCQVVSIQESWTEQAGPMCLLQNRIGRSCKQNSPLLQRKFPTNAKKLLKAPDPK